MTHPYEILLEYIDRFRSVIHHRSFPEKRVAMFHIGRCGSSVLARQLEHHRKIAWSREIYEPFFKKADATPSLPLHSHVPDPFGTIESAITATTRQVFGLEAKPYHLRRLGISKQDFMETLCTLGFDSFIVVDRKNKLRKIASSIKAHRSGVFHLKTGSTPAFEKIHIDPEGVSIDRSTTPLIKLIEEYEHDMAAIRTLLSGRNVLHLTYEDDIQHHPYEAYVGICDFLGIRPGSRRITLAKTTPFALRELVENYGEIQQTLKGTPHEWMLEE